MNYFRIVIFLVLSVCLLSCKMQSVLVDVYTPAARSLPPEVKSIIAISRYVPAQGDYEEITWGYYQSLDTAMLEVADSCLSGFASELSSSDHFRVRTPKGHRMFKHNGDDLPKVLPWGGLLSICKKEYANAIALLEGFSIREENPLVKVYEDSQGSGFTASQKIVVTTAWRIQEPEKHRTFVEDVFTFSKLITVSGETKEDALRNLPDRKDRLIMASAWAGQEFARLIKPGVVGLKRNYYSKGHPIIEETAAYVESGDWGKVESKWKKNAYQGETDELKAMCSFNMAMLSEKHGLLNQAMGFARRAQRIMPSNKHLEYINILNFRMLEQQDLIKEGKLIKNW